MALKTITTCHRYLREVTVHVDFPIAGGYVFFKQPSGGVGFRRWIDLNSALTRLMETHGVYVKTIQYPTISIQEDMVHEFMEEVFPGIPTETGWLRQESDASFE